ncbi:DUF1378 family protein [Escherichia coli]|uniref:DUF1378 family protein n=1 Tax=Escherichia coli TaxID=562 RepID=UPI0010AC58CD|nr:DUF1378 family protein [Escherichia coli]EFA4268442.1 DUF1378 family protein [Escherichia coli O145:H25]EET0019099.1 DUF1378 family protein [Escherichia coli]EET5526427.1 DUF1378 family protein [Escherichia coli]EEU0348543.1 DUF1378 family protein [Escherichia coli]EEV0324461.1 DUF1378 family protein [Escherichia coli]
MTFIHQLMLLFSTVVSALYLVSGGYKIIRNYIRKKIDAAAAEKISTGQAGGTKPEDPLIP